MVSPIATTTAAGQTVQGLPVAFTKKCPVSCQPASNSDQLPASNIDQGMSGGFLI
jgi:hypothetical protein